MSIRGMKQGALGLAAVLGLTVAGMAQNAANPFTSGSDVMFGVAGLFTHSTPVNSLEDSAGSTASLNIGYRLQATDRSGFVVRYAFSSSLNQEGNSSQITNPFQAQVPLYVHAYANELSVEYNYTLLMSEKWRPYVLGGVGVIAYIPENSSGDTVGVQSEMKGEVVYGAGADYFLNSKWAIRGEFRGLVHTTPLFRYPNAGLPSWTQQISPSVSLLWHFGS